MPVDYAGFWFKPNGFLDQNPAMDVPLSSQAHGSPQAGCCGGESCTCGH
jgi:primary-amine oxidase